MTYRRFTDYEDRLIANAEHGTLKTLSERLDCNYHSLVARRATLHGRLGSIRKPKADEKPFIPKPFARPAFFVEDLDKMSRRQR